MTDTVNTSTFNDMDPQVKARSFVDGYIVAHSNGTEKLLFSDIKVVWFTKTLQNWKAIVADIRPEGLFFEVTYSGDKKETYLDVYQKVENVRIPD